MIIEVDLYRRHSFTSPHRRQLHTFVPLPSAPPIPPLYHHMEVFRPTWSSIRSHLRPLSIRRGPCPIEENRSVSDSVQMDPSLSSRGVGMSTSSTPVNSPDREAHIPSPETEPVRPKAKEWRPEDARPKKKQRALGATPHSTPATTVRRFRWGHLPRTFSVKSSPGFSVIGQP